MITHAMTLLNIDVYLDLIIFNAMTIYFISKITLIKYSIILDCLNMCKMMVFLCRVLQKTLSEFERVCKQVNCVKSFEKRVFVLRTV